MQQNITAPVMIYHKTKKRVTIAMPAMHGGCDMVTFPIRLVYVSLFMGGLIYFVLQTAVVKSFSSCVSSNIEGAYVALFIKSLEE